MTTRWLPSLAGNTELTEGTRATAEPIMEAPPRISSEDRQPRADLPSLRAFPFYALTQTALKPGRLTDSFSITRR